MALQTSSPVANKNLRNWAKPEEVTCVDTKSVDLHKLHRVQDNSVRQPGEFLRRSVDKHLVPVAYHRKWTRREQEARYSVNLSPADQLRVVEEFLAELECPRICEVTCNGNE